MSASPEQPIAQHHERLPWLWHAGLQELALLAVALISAVAVRHGCDDPGVQFSGVEPGTSRAGYCSAVSGGAPWILWVVVPMAALAVWFVVPFARRRPAVGWLVLLGWVTAVIANAAIANSLAFSYTIT